MNHPKKEQTFVIIKPDGIQRSVVGEITKRFERTGFKLVHMEMKMLEEDKLWKHYAKDDAWFQKKGNGIVLTAITLLPEIISVLKD